MAVWPYSSSQHCQMLLEWCILSKPVAWGNVQTFHMCSGSGEAERLPPCNAAWLQALLCYLYLARTDSRIQRSCIQQSSLFQCRLTRACVHSPPTESLEKRKSHPFLFCSLHVCLWAKNSLLWCHKGQNYPVVSENVPRQSLILWSETVLQQPRDYCIPTVECPTRH